FGCLPFGHKTASLFLVRIRSHFCEPAWNQTQGSLVSSTRWHPTACVTGFRATASPLGGPRPRIDAQPQTPTWFTSGRTYRAVFFQGLRAVTIAPSDRILHHPFQGWTSSSGHL